MTFTKNISNSKLMLWKPKVSLSTSNQRAKSEVGEYDAEGAVYGKAAGDETLKKETVEVHAVEVENWSLTTFRNVM